MKCSLFGTDYFGLEGVVAAAVDAVGVGFGVVVERAVVDTAVAGTWPVAVAASDH